MPKRDVIYRPRKQYGARVNHVTTVNEWRVADMLDSLEVWYRTQITVYPGIRVDFVCVGLDLIIEVDDDSHRIQARRRADQLRDQELQSLGFTVLRVTNRQIEHDYQAVCGWLADEIEQARATAECDVNQGLKKRVR